MDIVRLSVASPTSVKHNSQFLNLCNRKLFPLGYGHPLAMIFREPCFLKNWANSKYTDFVKHIDYLYRDSRPYLGWLLSFTYSSLLFWLFLNKTKKSGNCQNVGKICPKFSSLSVLHNSIINNITIMHATFIVFIFIQHRAAE